MKSYIIFLFLSFFSIFSVLFWQLFHNFTNTINFRNEILKYIMGGDITEITLYSNCSNQQD